jgi:hypothetical protein
MNIEGPYLGQLDASFSARRDHLCATPEESATRCSTGRAQVARVCRRSSAPAVVAALYWFTGWPLPEILSGHVPGPWSLSVPPRILLPLTVSFREPAKALFPASPEATRLATGRGGVITCSAHCFRRPARWPVMRAARGFAISKRCTPGT